MCLGEKGRFLGKRWTDAGGPSSPLDPLLFTGLCGSLHLMSQGRRCKWPTTPLPCQPPGRPGLLWHPYTSAAARLQSQTRGAAVGAGEGPLQPGRVIFCVPPLQLRLVASHPAVPSAAAAPRRTNQPASQPARPAPSRPQRTPEARDAPTQRARPELASRSRASRVPPRAFARRIHGREREREGEGPRVARTHQLASGDPSRCRWDVRRPSAVPFQAQTSSSRLAPPRAGGSTRPRSLPQHTQPRSQSTAGMRRAPARRGWPARLRTSPQPLSRTACREM